ncbi:MAG: hypothetical protein G01um101470_868, partial [Parcubacteria group bacterium Gr01-1014_70]
ALVFLFLLTLGWDVAVVEAVNSGTLSPIQAVQLQTILEGHVKKVTVCRVYGNEDGFTNVPLCRSGGGILFAGKFLLTVAHLRTPRQELARGMSGVFTLMFYGEKLMKEAWILQFPAKLFGSDHDETVAIEVREVFEDRDADILLLQIEKFDREVPIEAASLPVSLGDSDSLSLTTPVLLGGNPFGDVGPEVRLGIVSALTAIDGSANPNRFFRVSMPICEGDSGHWVSVMTENGLEVVGLAHAIVVKNVSNNPSGCSSMGVVLRINALLSIIQEKTKTADLPNGIDIRNEHKTFLREQHMKLYPISLELFD